MKRHNQILILKKNEMKKHREKNIIFKEFKNLGLIKVLK